MYEDRVGIEGRIRGLHYQTNPIRATQCSTTDGSKGGSPSSPLMCNFWGGTILVAKMGILFMRRRLLVSPSGRITAIWEDVKRMKVAVTVSQMAIVLSCLPSTAIVRKESMAYVL